MSEIKRKISHSNYSVTGKYEIAKINVLKIDKTKQTQSHTKTTVEGIQFSFGQRLCNRTIRGISENHSPEQISDSSDND